MARSGAANENPATGRNASPHHALADNTLAPGRFRPSDDVFRLQPWRSALALVGDWLLIAAAFAVAMHTEQPLVLFAAALVIARSQLALSVMMHEGAHRLLANRRWLNDAMGQLFAAGPLWLSLASYRSGHLKHHRAPMQADDPVAVLFGLGDFPMSRRRLALRLLAYASGIGYLTTVWHMLRGDFREVLPTSKKSARHVAWEIATMLLSNGLIFGLLALAGHPWLYVGLWLLPSITLLPLAGQIRAIFEHGGLPACSDQSRNARTIARPSWQTFWFGPHAVHHHVAHHLYTRIPFYKLSAAYRQLVQAQLLAPCNAHGGYGSVLREVTRPAPIAR